MRKLAIALPLVFVAVLLGVGPANGSVTIGSAPSALEPRFDRSIVALDPRGDGTAVQVVGDLAHAEHIAVVVPGVANRLGNFWTGLGHIARRSPAWQAEQVYEQARALDPYARVAVVAWLGYDAPDGIGMAAVREDQAATGADALVRFVTQIVRYNPRAGVTLIGHSYGSTVVGLAVHRLGDTVGDVVAVGSPGMGVRRAGDLHATARVWAGAADKDWIRRVPGVRLFGLGHGRLPSTPAFGALPLPVDGVAEHDGYFVPGTGSLRAMAFITLGTMEGCSELSTCTTRLGEAPSARS